MKIKIDNQTNYDTATLRDLLRRCFAAVGIPGKSPTEIHVWVRNHRNRDPSYASGRARVGRSPVFHANWMLLKLPLGAVSYGRLTWLIWHEALHLVGAEHKDMTPEQRGPGGNTAPTWALPAPGELVTEREKVAACVPSPESKLAHAQEKLAQAITREKRAATIRKKWARRVKLYARKVTS